MQTLSVDVSDVECSVFGITETKFKFSDLVDTISRALMRKNLTDCVQLAERYGLSDMSLDDINAEIEAVRQNAAQHS
jgi:hypothetical protein